MGPEKTQLPPAAGATEPLRPGAGSDGGDTSLSEALATLRKRRWIWILAAVLGAGYGSYKAFTQPKVFVAASTIQVHNGASNEYRVDTSGDYEDDSETRMNTESFILKSDTLLEGVALQLNLANNQDFWGATSPLHLSMDDPNVRTSVLGTLKSGLQITLVPHTELINISYMSLSPRLSAEIVNEVVAQYMQRSLHTPEQRTETAANSLEDQLAKLKTKVETSQEADDGVAAPTGSPGVRFDAQPVAVVAGSLAECGGRGKSCAHHGGVSLPDGGGNGPEYDRTIDRDDSGDPAG